MMWAALRSVKNSDGFHEDPGTEVDILGILRLETDDHQSLPGLTVRMVLGQHDDLLVSAPDLDYLGWCRDDYTDLFEMKNCGIAVPRETPTPDNLGGPLDASQNLLAPPHGSGLGRQWVVER